MIKHFIYMLLSLIGILVNPWVAVNFYEPMGFITEQMAQNNVGVITGVLISTPFSIGGLSLEQELRHFGWVAF